MPQSTILGPNRDENSLAILLCFVYIQIRLAQNTHPRRITWKVNISAFIDDRSVKHRLDRGLEGLRGREDGDCRK